MVAERMTRPWSPDEINIVEQQRHAIEAGNRTSLRRELGEEWRTSLDHEPSPEELRAKQQEIDEEVDRRIPSQTEQYWQRSLDNECKHFDMIARRLLGSWTHGENVRNAWLIIAVTKADLHWHGRMDDLKRYYVPSPEVPLSPFGERLSEFILGFGSGPKPQLAIVPSLLGERTSKSCPTWRRRPRNSTTPGSRRCSALSRTRWESSVGSRSEAESRYTSGDDFERFLREAEALLTAVDGARDRYRRYLIVERIAVAAILATGVCALIAVLPHYIGAAATVAAFVVLATILVNSLRRNVRAPLNAEIYRDEKVMAGMVNILRELLPLISENERWLELRITQTRMRIGRFPIEPRGRR
ncbi:hypothetical protein NKG94_12850 [Micromonospora sp. M12]